MRFDWTTNVLRSDWLRNSSGNLRTAIAPEGPSPPAGMAFTMLIGMLALAFTG